MSYLCYRQGNSVRKDDIEGQGQVLKNGEGNSVKETKTLKTYILDPREKFLKRWSVGFVLSCVTAVAVDPLFFYLPVINQNKKCIGFDSRLWKTTLVLRSFFDIIYLLHIILQFHTGFIDEELRKWGKSELNTDAWKIAQKYLWPWFLLDILTILPIPQVVVPIIISEMRGTESTHKVKFLNAVVLFQYVPRVYQIYISWRKLITNDQKFGSILLVKAPLNFIQYILAGHVLGAFWYFFSTQRLTSCWHKSCEIHIECVRSSFNCDHSLGNHSFLNDFCPINTPNATLFDFGIFVDALQSGVVKSPDFPQKLFYCFWWGMQNLSSLGQSLKTSNYVWENLFAFSISISGLFLFLYFVENLQRYVHWRRTIKKEKESLLLVKNLVINWDGEGMRRKWRERRKQLLNLKSWMSKHRFDRTTSDKIIDYIYKSYEADEDVYVETLIPDLPSELQSNVKRHICLDLLKSLKIINDLGLAKRTQVLHNICDSPKPMFYNEHCYIIREGEPIDAVFFITDGIVWTYTSNNSEGTNSQHAERLVNGQYFGVCHLPPTTCAAYPYFLFLQKPSKPTQKWKPSL